MLSTRHVSDHLKKAILLSQTAKKTGAHLQQPDNEANEVDD